MLGIIGLRIEGETVLLPGVARLAASMDDDDMEVRDESAEALGVIASRVNDDVAVRWAIAALIRGLADRSGEVREESAEALARIASTIQNKTLLEPAVDPLRKMLAASANATQAFARGALESLGRVSVMGTGAKKSSAGDLRRGRYLVLDARIIESTENVHLTIGVARKDENTPLFKGERPTAAVLE